MDHPAIKHTHTHTYTLSHNTSISTITQTNKSRLYPYPYHARESQTFCRVFIFSSALLNCMPELAFQITFSKFFFTEKDLNKPAVCICYIYQIRFFFPFSKKRSYCKEYAPALPGKNNNGKCLNYM